MSCIATDWALTRGLNGTRQMILLALAEYAHPVVQRGVITGWESAATGAQIAAISGMSMRTVHRHLKALHAAGLVSESTGKSLALKGVA